MLTIIDRFVTTDHSSTFRRALPRCDAVLRVPVHYDAVTDQRTGSEVTFELVPDGALPLTVDQQYL